MASKTIKLEGGPKDGDLLAVEGDPHEYRVIEMVPLTVTYAISKFPTILDKSYVEHIYKKSVSDPYIYWYAGSTL